MIRIIKKSIRTIKRFGFREFLKRFMILIDRKTSPSKYFHQIDSTAGEVLFISGEPKNATSYYRCEIPKLQLESVGITCDIVHEDFVNLDWIIKYKYVVFYRTILNDINRQVLEICKKNGIKTFFSVDDFVYRSDLIQGLDYYKNLDPVDSKRLIDRADSMVELMKNVDGGISSTNYLVGDMKKYIKGEVFVLRNGYKDRCDTLNSERINRGLNDKMILGYFSGSETHDRDIDLFYPSLVKLFAKHSNLEMWVGGRFNYDFGEYKARVKKMPFVPRDKFMKLLFNIDINLLPLEDNEFNRGKSEIKFIEGALLGIVTVASNVGDLPEIIKHGETGFLVKTLDDWYEIISNLIDQRDKIVEIGQNARKYVLGKYAIEKSGKEFADFLRK